MKKVLLGLSIASLVFCAFGCSKKSETSTAATAAAPAAEVMKSIEVKYQMNDATAADPNAALHCVYISGTGMGDGSVTLVKADVKTSGQCKWNELSGKAASAGMLSADVTSKIVNQLSATSGMPAIAKDKWDCAAINVKTNVRMVGVQSCKNGSGAGDAVAKTIAGMLGL